MTDDKPPLGPDLESLDPPAGPPAVPLWRELSAATQPLRLMARRRQLGEAPAGDGRVVVAVPGFKFGDGSSRPLRRYLAGLGYHPQGWGLGVNRGAPEEDAARLMPRIQELAATSGPVSLVGWSLGGVIAREVARSLPGQVHSVVMYGSPVVGGPNHTIARRMFDPIEAADTAARLAQLDLDSPVQVPVTSIYSRQDGVVNWLACVDRWTPGAQHVEVRTSHMGMPLAPDVWVAVAAALAQSPAG